MTDSRKVTFSSLNHDVIGIRKKVFVEEQGFKNEFDDIDEYATHLLLKIDDKPVATLRFFYSKEHDCHVIGRVAVVKEHRGEHLGSYIMNEAEKELRKMNVSKVGLSAQVQAKVFYEKMGYEEKGEVYLDEGCPHIWMEKQL